LTGASLDETATTARLRPGEVAAGQVVRLRVGDVPMGDLVVAVDDDGVGGQVAECDERDNEARAPNPCGG